MHADRNLHMKKTPCWDLLYLEMFCREKPLLTVAVNPLYSDCPSFPTVLLSLVDACREPAWHLLLLLPGVGQLHSVSLVSGLPLGDNAHFLQFKSQMRATKWLHRRVLYSLAEALLSHSPGSYFCLLLFLLEKFSVPQLNCSCLVKVSL